MGGSAKEVPETRKVMPIPEGFHTVTPYITVKRAEQLINFVKQAFGATETFRTTGSAGGLHAEVRIGDSMLMMGGSEQMTHPETPTALHFFVPDADAVYQRALQAGATSIQAPSDQDYGERVGAVKDPFGNEWYIATNKGEHYIPEGLRTVNVYLHPGGADRLIDFLKEALGAEVVARYAGPDGSVAHAEVKIGDSVIEVGEAHGPYQPMPTMLYLYVEDVDAHYPRAVQAGGIAVQAPAEMPYGDRTAHVKDAFGNSWYLATHVKDATM
jgi:PhnB protein